MQVRFQANMLNSQRYAGKGDIGVSGDSITINGRKAWPIYARLGVAIAVEVVLLLIIGMTGAGLLFVGPIGLLVLWEIASSLGRSRKAETFALSSVQNVKISGLSKKALSFRVRASNSRYGVKVQGKKEDIASLAEQLQQ